MSGWAAVAQAGMEIGGALINQRFAESLQHQSQDFSAQQYANRYQTQVADLKKAGLNPMLAYMQSPGSSPSVGIASAARANMGNTVGAYNETRIASAQEANIRASTVETLQKARTGSAQERNYDADTLYKAGLPSLVAAQVVQLTSSAEQANAAAAKIRAEIHQIEAQIKELQSRVAKNKSDVSLNNSLEQANTYLNGLRAAETYLTNAKIRNVMLEGDIMDPKAKAAKTATAEIGHVADNIGKIGSAAWKFLFPSLTN